MEMAMAMAMESTIELRVKANEYPLTGTLSESCRFAAMFSGNCRTPALVCTHLLNWT